VMARATKSSLVHRLNLSHKGFDALSWHHNV
jgi:hypothetical protein